MRRRRSHYCALIFGGAARRMAISRRRWRLLAWHLAEIGRNQLRSRPANARIMKRREIGDQWRNRCFCR